MRQIHKNTKAKPTTDPNQNVDQSSCLSLASRAMGNEKQSAPAQTKKEEPNNNEHTTRRTEIKNKTKKNPTKITKHSHKNLAEIFHLLA